MGGTQLLKSRFQRFTLLTFIIGAVLISFSGVWVKVAHVAPNVSAFYRVFIGGAALLIAALYRRELRWPGVRHLLLSFLCGLLLAMDMWLYHFKYLPRSIQFYLTVEASFRYMSKGELYRTVFLDGLFLHTFNSRLTDAGR